MAPTRGVPVKAPPACSAAQGSCYLVLHTVLVLQVGPANNASSLSRLDGLEVYARPKADIVKEAATATEAEAAEAGGGNLDANLALAAVSLPGHLVAQKAGQTCSVYVLSQGLLTLTSLHQCLAGGVSYLFIVSCLNLP